MSSRSFQWRVFGVIALVFVALCALQWKAPAIEDEVLMHKGALIWLAKGADWFEMSHTPLYLEATSVWQRIFGAATSHESAAVLRSMGVFTGLLTALLLMWGLLQQKSREDRLSAVPWLAAAVLMLHPYFIQYCLLLDYDTTVLGPPLLLFAILVERHDAREKPGWGLVAALGLVFGAALFAKELTPLIFVVLWPFWILLRRWRAPSGKWTTHFMQAVAALALGFALFVALLMIWGKIRGFHWYDPLMMSRRKFFDRKAGGGLLPWKTWGWSRYVFLNYLPFLWIGAPTIFVFVKLRASATRASKNVVRLLASVPFSLYAAAAIFAAYAWLVQASFYFPKYSAPAWPLLVFGMARYIRAPGFKLRPREDAAILVAMLVLGLNRLVDPLMLIEHRAALDSAAVAAHLRSLFFPVAALWIVTLGERRRGQGPVTAVVLLGLLAYFLGTDIRNVSADYQTRYLYGEHGFHETVAAVRALKARVSPDRPVLSVARDIAWYLDRDSDYYEMDGHDAGRTTDWNTKVVVSRSYGASAIRSNAGAMREISAKFPCHAVIPTEGNHYEWWWIPPAGQSCGATQ